MKELYSNHYFESLLYMGLLLSVTRSPLTSSFVRRMHKSTRKCSSTGKGGVVVVIICFNHWNFISDLIDRGRTAISSFLENYDLRHPWTWLQCFNKFTVFEASYQSLNEDSLSYSDDYQYTRWDHWQHRDRRITSHAHSRDHTISDVTFFNFMMMHWL